MPDNNGKAIKDDDSTAAKLAKLLPAEVTALYLAIRPFLVQLNMPTVSLLGVAVCLVLAVAFIRKQRGVTSWAHTAFYIITFGTWVLMIEPNNVSGWLGDLKLTLSSEQCGTIAAIVSILWTFVISYVIPTKWIASDTTANDGEPAPAPAGS
jgi:hypothetical protein